MGFGISTTFVNATGPTGRAELVSTTDGGSTWHAVGPAPVGDGPTAVEPPTLAFVDASNGIEYGTRGAFVTHDGGRRWAQIPVSGRVVASTAVGRRLWLTDSTCTVSPTTAPCTVGVEASNDAGTWKALDLPSEPFRAAQTAVGTRGTLVVAEWGDHEGYPSNNPGSARCRAPRSTAWAGSSPSLLPRPRSGWSAAARERSEPARTSCTARRTWAPRGRSSRATARSAPGHAPEHPARHRHNAPHARRGQPHPRVRGLPRVPAHRLRRFVAHRRRRPDLAPASVARVHGVGLRPHRRVIGATGASRQARAPYQLPAAWLGPFKPGAPHIRPGRG